jgi:flagellar hook-associated protein 1 FlgK
MSISLGSIINTAASGLSATQASISVLSDNVANAGVANYTAKTLNTSTFVAGGQASGVAIGNVTRSVDSAVQASLLAAGANVSGLTTKSTVLSAINAVQGTPGDGSSLADAVTALENSFTSLAAQPSSSTQQSAVVSAATTLAQSINNAASSITTERNDVQTQIVSTVTEVNTALATVQQTTQQIMAATAAGTSTATLEDQRDAALSTLSNDLGVTGITQSNGNITLQGTNGLSIPLDSRLSTTAANMAPGAYYAADGTGTVPGIYLQSSNSSSSSIDVTSKLTGGTMGALISLRDTTLPTYTAQLDEFSESLATKFSAQGLTLFTDPSGAVPTTTSGATQSGYIGFSSTIEVNPAVAVDPALVRDGTQNVTGSATGASSFTVNPAGGPSDFNTLVNRVLNYTFGTDVADGVPQTTTAMSGLGPNGTLSSQISSISTLSGYAETFVADQSADTSAATTSLATATAYQTSVANRFADGSGVNVDGEMGLMIQLQNSYQANAQVVTTVQAMFTALFNAVSGQ